MRMGGPGNYFHLQEVLVFIRQLRLLGLPSSSPYACCDELGRTPKYLRNKYTVLWTVFQILLSHDTVKHTCLDKQETWAGAVSLDRTVFFIQMTHCCLLQCKANLSSTNGA